MMELAQCNHCGAKLEEMICAYCGALHPTILSTETIDEQLIALQTLHEKINTSQKEQQVRLLTSGYVPKQKAALIEAGLRCLPMLIDGNEDQVSAAIQHRLEAIMVRLRLFPNAANQSDITQALSEFEKKLARHQRVGRINLIYGFIVIVLFLGLIVGGIFFLFRSCR